MPHLLSLLGLFRPLVVISSLVSYLGRMHTEIIIFLLETRELGGGFRRRCFENFFETITKECGLNSKVSQTGRSY